jgi:hypothetical protein
VSNTEAWIFAFIKTETGISVIIEYSGAHSQCDLHITFPVLTAIPGAQTADSATYVNVSTAGTGPNGSVWSAGIT